MAEKIKVVLIKPLDRMAVGATAEFDKVDAERLRDQQAVKFVKAEPAAALAAPPAPAAKPPVTPAPKAKA